MSAYRKFNFSTLSISEPSFRMTIKPKSAESATLAAPVCQRGVARPTNKVLAADDWRAFFDERAGIAEFDGGLSRTDAEASAYKSCISEWLFQNPPAPHGRDSCALCGRAMTNQTATPFLTRDGHVWMHSDCHPDWMERRRLEAVTALAALGLSLEDTATASPDNIGVEP